MRDNPFESSVNAAKSESGMLNFGLTPALRVLRICLANMQTKQGRIYLAYVNLREGEDPEALLKRFQTSMQRSGILRELRNRRFFRSKGEQARLDKQRSLRRIRRRRRR